MTVVYPVWGSEDGLVAVASTVQKALKAAREYMSVAPGGLYSGQAKITVDLLKTFFQDSHMRSIVMNRKGEGIHGLSATHVKITVVELNKWPDGEDV